MIAVDTSALMAIVLNEPAADACISALAEETEIVVSAGTVAEALIVADHRNVGAEMRSIIEDLGFEVVPVTSAVARRIAEVYARWGKGLSRSAALNFGDCFAYEVANERDCRLLFVGEDFAGTDIKSAL